MANRTASDRVVQPLRACVIAVLALGCAVACRKTPPPPPPGTLVDTPVIAEFRAGERAVLARFNDALGRQRANQIDELGLAEAIDTEVLPPWRELRAHVSAAVVPAPDRELFATLARYLGERENAWGAYSAALRTGNDAAAAPHYAKYHEQDAAADADARWLGAAFRRLSPKPGS
ncbi:MAG: hypothetical protein ABI467_28740 [Kofleriaceae bacterium]